MSDRGEYRAIRRTMPSRPQVQLLGSNARLVLLMLKIDLPPEGIDVRYPEALMHQLAGLTGLKPEEVQLNLDILERYELIVREGNLIWVIDQLDDDPFNMANPRHKKGVQNTINALPHTKIVARFIMHYKEWFKGDGDCLSNAFIWAENSQSIGNKGNRKGKGRQSKGNALAIDCPPHARAQSNPNQSNPTTSSAGADGGSSSAGSEPPPDPLEWPPTWAYDTQQVLQRLDVVFTPGIIGDHAKALRGTIPWDEWLRIVERMANADACKNGWPAALRRLKEFRDAAQPDPNRPLTSEEVARL